MKRSVHHKIRGFDLKQWFVLAGFILVLSFTGFLVFQTAHRAIYWSNHRDEPIRGWMTIGYVAHSYRVPPHVLSQALGLPPKPPDRRPLREIAHSQHRSFDEVKSILEDAITKARPPYSPPSPDDQRGAP